MSLCLAVFDKMISTVTDTNQVMIATLTKNMHLLNDICSFLIRFKVLVTSKKDTFFFSKAWSSLLIKYKLVD